jgi:hypothetical protein
MPDLNSELTSNSNTTLLCFHIPRTPLISLRAIFFLFPRLKKRLKGRRHENIEAIQAAATMKITGIPKEAFTSCFQDLQKRWQQCIEFCIFYRLSLRTLRTKDVLHQRISSGPRQLYPFRNTASFYGKELSAPHPTPKLEYHPLSVVLDCLFNILTATLHIGGRSSIRNLRTRRAVVIGTHLSWVSVLKVVSVSGM